MDADGSLGFAANGQPFVSLCTSSPAMAEAYCEFVEEVSGERKRALALPRKAARAREVLGWERPADLPRRPPFRWWTDAEDEVVASSPVTEAMEVLGRTRASIVMRRRRLRAAAHGDG